MYNWNNIHKSEEGNIKRDRKKDDEGNKAKKIPLRKWSLQTLDPNMSLKSIQWNCCTVRQVIDKSQKIRHIARNFLEEISP